MRGLPPPMTSDSRLRTPSKASPSLHEAAREPLSPLRSLHSDPTKDMPPASAVLIAARSPISSPRALTQHNAASLEEYGVRLHQLQLQRQRPQREQPSKPSPVREKSVELVKISVQRKRKKATVIPRLLSTNANVSNNTIDQQNQRQQHQRQQNRNANKPTNKKDRTALLDDEENSGRHLNAGVYVLEDRSTGHRFFSTTWDLRNAQAQSLVDFVTAFILTRR